MFHLLFTPKLLSINEMSSRLHFSPVQLSPSLQYVKFLGNSNWSTNLFFAKDTMACFVPSFFHPVLTFVSSKNTKNIIFLGHLKCHPTSKGNVEESSIFFKLSAFFCPISWHQ
jgi:hypothetical protein